MNWQRIIIIGYLWNKLIFLNNKLSRKARISKWKYRGKQLFTFMVIYNIRTKKNNYYRAVINGWNSSDFYKNLTRQITLENVILLNENTILVRQFLLKLIVEKSILRKPKRHYRHRLIVSQNVKSDTRIVRTVRRRSSWMHMDSVSVLFPSAGGHCRGPVFGRLTLRGQRVTADFSQTPLLDDKVHFIFVKYYNNRNIFSDGPRFNRIHTTLFRGRAVFRHEFAAPSLADFPRIAAPGDRGPRSPPSPQIRGWLPHSFRRYPRET